MGVGGCCKLEVAGVRDCRKTQVASWCPIVKGFGCCALGEGEVLDYRVGRDLLEGVFVGAGHGAMLVGREAAVHHTVPEFVHQNRLGSKLVCR